MASENEKPVSEKVIGRLSIYRRILEGFSRNGMEKIHSHHLAQESSCSAAQVRRDLMAIEYYGNPARGYKVPELIIAIDRFLDHPEGTQVVLVGLGNLGRAVLDYFENRRPKLKIIAAFDRSPEKVNREYHGTPAYSIAEFSHIVRGNNVRVGIICVPFDQAAQVADLMIETGITAILNFAPIPIKVPSHVYLEDVDLIMTLEKVAYFSRMSLSTSHGECNQNQEN